MRAFRVLCLANSLKPERRCVIIANSCVVFGIRPQSFTSVNFCRPHPQRLAFINSDIPKRGCIKTIVLTQPLLCIVSI